MSGITSIFNSVAAYSQPAHAHDSYMLMLPQQGLMRFTDEDGDWSTTLLERQVLLVPPDRAHSTASLSTTQSHCAFYVEADVMAHALRELSASAESFLRRPVPGVWAASPTLQHLLVARSHMRGNSASHGHAQRLAAMDHLLLLECAATALRGPGIQRSTTQRHGAALVREVKAYLAGTLDQAPDIDAIAAAFHISRRHLTRLFQEHGGQSLLDFTQTMRMARARDLLEHTRLSVLDIAQTVGLGSPSHFAALFRRSHGQSPDGWRRMKAAAQDPPPPTLTR
ncbi:AraC family transcriptional regulator [Novosphingobium sp.]|uniref:AraC family transcriptional regulator n=1 Tax=Novosphingobium sp. TaxID=1874826 RepID=UPI0031E092C0